MLAKKTLRMKKIIYWVLSVVLLTTLTLGAIIMEAPVESQAANVCSQIKGNSKAIKTFIVNTGSSWGAKDYIKFTQTKGTMKKSSSTKAGIQGTRVTMYEYYTITVEKLNKSNNKVISRDTINFYGSKKTVKLSKNSKYRITITPLYVTHEKNVKNDKINNYLTYNPYAKKGLLGVLANMFTGKYKWVPRGWDKASTWTVTSTKGIKGCSFQ